MQTESFSSNVFDSATCCTLSRFPLGRPDERILPGAPNVSQSGRAIKGVCLFEEPDVNKYGVCSITPIHFVSRDSDISDMMQTLLLTLCLFITLVDWSVAKIIVIDVSKPAHQFGPNVTTAEEGDEIEFHFQNSNHSVVRATVENPCQPFDYLSDQNGPGFFSGFLSHEPGNGEIPTWKVRVNNTDPIYFYCSALNSCNKYKMIGIINPSPETDFQKQAGKIQDSTPVHQPGDKVPPEGSPSSTPTSTSTPTAPAKPPAHHLVLPLAAIIGISVGGFVVLVLAAALFFFVGRSKSLKEEARRREATVTRQTFPSAQTSPSYNPPPVSPSIYTDNGSGLPGYEKTAAPEYHPYQHSRVDPNEAAYLRSSTASPGSQYGGGGYGQMGMGSPRSDEGGVVELDAVDGRHTR
ncbi:hypothetical protein P280DRAFT_515993 [Massarina eburnea CBS 473.64]|uniref:Cupredoxin n=1 Tax=Massarina eburnea CBS 473.64 TaxID=1395130 RepID=A0A6A6S8S5_9PLEO|nr:hypothetical protein P280DRAFT_515993 [Massarina eburnea CBS 473.64]